MGSTAEFAPGVLFQKKTMKKMASQQMESVASAPSAFALKMMKKSGWKEGEGLGKDSQAAPRTFE